MVVASGVVVVAAGGAVVGGTVVGGTVGFTMTGGIVTGGFTVVVGFTTTGGTVGGTVVGEPGSRTTGGMVKGGIVFGGIVTGGSVATVMSSMSRSGTIGLAEAAPAKTTNAPEASSPTAMVRTTPRRTRSTVGRFWLRVLE